MSTDMDMQAFAFDELDAVLETPEIFIPFGQTVPITIGQPAKFTANIDGHQVPYQVVFESARLTRLTQIVNKSQRTGAPYNLVTGQFNAVEAKLTVNVGQNEDGTKKFISLEEWIRTILNASRDEAKRITAAAWAEQCEAMGFRWSSGGPMVLLFQHFGASQRKLLEIFDIFIDAGAVDVTGNYDPEKLGRMRRIVTHSPGLPVTAFEIGQADRDESQTHQGFEDLLETQWDNFKRVIKMRNEAAVLSKELAKIERDDKVDPEDVSALRGDVAILRRQSSRWVNSWSGAQQRTTIQADGTLSQGDEWDPQNMPCGRISVQIPVFAPMVDEETNEPIVIDGQKQMVRSKVPLLDNNENPVMQGGQPVLINESKVIEFDLWKAQDDPGDNPPADEEVDASGGEDDEDNAGF